MISVVGAGTRDRLPRRAVRGVAVPHATGLVVLDRGRALLPQVPGGELAEIVTAVEKIYKEPPRRRPTRIQLPTQRPRSSPGMRELPLGRRRGSSSRWSALR